MHDQDTRALTTKPANEPTTKPTNDPTNDPATGVATKQYVQAIEMTAMQRVNNAHQAQVPVKS